MEKYRVYLNYNVECKAKGYMDVEARSQEEAIVLAEDLANDIKNTDLEEQEIISITDVTDVEKI